MIFETIKMGAAVSSAVSQKTAKSFLDDVQSGLKFLLQAIKSCCFTSVEPLPYEVAPSLPAYTNSGLYGGAHPFCHPYGMWISGVGWEDPDAKTPIFTNERWYEEDIWVSCCNAPVAPLPKPPLASYSDDVVHPIYKMPNVVDGCPMVVLRAYFYPVANLVVSESAEKTNSGLYGGSHPRRRALTKKARRYEERSLARFINQEKVTNSRGVPIHASLAKQIRGLGRYRSGPGDVLHGRGGFWGDLWNGARKYVPRAIGAGAGYLTGAGAAAGWDSGANFSRNVLGWGSYGVPWTVTSNSLAQSSIYDALITDGNMPKIGGGSDHSTEITHVEPLCGVYASPTFAVTPFAFNPAQSSTFAWLSGIAANYQQYQWLGAVLVYKPVMGDSVTGAAMGEVLLAIEENPSAPSPINQNAMKSMHFCAYNKPSMPIIAPVECAKDSVMPFYYTRPNAVPTGSVIQSYDAGRILVAVYGQANATIATGTLMGNVSIAYHVKCINPVVIVGATIDGLLCTNSTGVVSGAPFGTAGSVVNLVDSFGGCALTSTTLTIPADNTGTYMLQYNVVCASGANTVSQISTITNGKVVNTGLLNTGSFMSQASPGVGETSTKCASTNYFQITDPALPTVVTMTVGVLTGGGTNMKLSLTQVSAYWN
jgi:hypothetical protein